MEATYVRFDDLEEWAAFYKAGIAPALRDVVAGLTNGM
ncbi:hypothetical protein J2754_003015 [Halarchaeum solikamskense]|nr:hypothetical protein [Halarchaeum solikamskense]